MAKVTYRADFEKFVESLSPEQMVFLGSIIEKDIEKKDFVLLDQLANVMYEKLQAFNIDELHEKTHKAFSKASIEN